MSVVGNSLGTATGVAPRAHVAVYKVCGASGCYNSDAVAAIQQAVLDGVDIINYAVGGGTNPFSDPVSLAFLDAYNAGVFVATAAGNTGLGTVNHASPWTTTAGATTINRSFQSTLYLAATRRRRLDADGSDRHRRHLLGHPDRQCRRLRRSELRQRLRRPVLSPAGLSSVPAAATREPKRASTSSSAARSAWC